MVSDLTVRELQALNQESDEAITIYLNSTGGVVDDSIKIINEIRKSSGPITTVCIGKSSGMTTLILASGANRFAISDSQISMVPVTKNGDTVGGPILEVIRGLLTEFTKLTNADIDKAITSGLHVELHDWIDLGVIDQVLEKKKS